MLEWLSSRLAVVLATTLLLSSITAAFLGQHEYAQRRELGLVARSLATFVDSVFSLQGVVELKVTHCCDGDLVLPRDAGGQAYSVQLRRDSVILEGDGKSAIEHWSGVLHFWRWDGIPLNRKTVERLDNSTLSLSLTPGQDFLISVEKVSFMDSEPLLVFARPMVR